MGRVTLRNVTLKERWALGRDHLRDRDTRTDPDVRQLLPEAVLSTIGPTTHIHPSSDNEADRSLYALNDDSPASLRLRAQTRLRKLAGGSAVVVRVLLLCMAMPHWPLFALCIVL